MLDIKNLFVTISENSLLRNINFSVQPGERVGIVGSNGSGKTTLFNTISGFIFVTKGEIFFNSLNITRLSSWDRAKLGLGRTFQSSGLFPKMTVFENILTAIEAKNKSHYSLLPWGKNRKKEFKETQDLVERFSLQSLANKQASLLSGGQKRLVEIVRTLALSPKLLLLDEPTAGVDIKTRHELLTLLKKLSEDGLTILIIEHDLTFIEGLCTRVVTLEVGEIIKNST
jgi:branched-chain amino acid transport system ATP-binding protein